MVVKVSRIPLSYHIMSYRVSGDFLDFPPVKGRGWGCKVTFEKKSLSRVFKFLNLQIHETTNAPATNGEEGQVAQGEVHEAVEQSRKKPKKSVRFK